MKNKVVIVILAVVCLGLAVALIAGKKQAADQHAHDTDSIGEYSNQVVTANEHLKEVAQVNLTLSNELSSSQHELNSTGEQLSQMSNALSTASAALIDTKATLATTQELVTNLNSRIASLEDRNRELDQQVTDLTNALAQLNQKIEETKNELTVARTNRAFLQGELQKQLATKAELEHRFNDLAELRAQVKKIRDEMFVTRRLLLSRSDNGAKKGATLLMMRPESAEPAAGKQPNPAYDLNVEVGSDGSVKVISPLGGTNRPAR